MPTLTILLALDEEEIRTLASHQLMRAGHRVVGVGDGREAIKAAQQVRFDVVLLDEQMPVAGVIETARAFRQLSSDSNPVPLLVAVTSNASDQDRERLRAAGFDEVLTKPFRMEALSEILSRLSARTTDVSAPDAADGRDENPVEVLSRHVNGDKNLMQKLIASFLRDLPPRMISLKLALKRGDAAEVGSLAHALKGSVSIFGASQARARSEELQTLGRKGDLQPAQRLLKFLREDIAQLEQKLRGYAQPAKTARRVKARKRTRSRGTQHKRK